MANITKQNLDRLQRIVDEGGIPTQYFIRFIQQRGGALTDLDALITQLFDLLDNEIIAGDGLIGGGMLSDGDVTLALPTTGVTPGVYGDDTNVPQITVDEFGRITDVEDIPISSSGGGGLSLVGSTVMPGGTSSTSFTAIPATFKNLLVRVYGRSTTAGDNDAVLMRLNGDTGANYPWNRQGAADTGSTFSGGNNSDTSAVIGFVAASGSTAGYSGSLETLIPHYADTVFKKTGYGLAVGKGGGGVYQMNIGWGWNNTAAITQVDIRLASGNFVAGSIVELLAESY